MLFLGGGLFHMKHFSRPEEVKVQLSQEINLTSMGKKSTKFKVLLFLIPLIILCDLSDWEPRVNMYLLQNN